MSITLPYLSIAWLQIKTAYLNWVCQRMVICAELYCQINKCLSCRNPPHLPELEMDRLRATCAGHRCRDDLAGNLALTSNWNTTTEFWGRILKCTSIEIISWQLYFECYTMYRANREATQHPNSSAHHLSLSKGVGKDRPFRCSGEIAVEILGMWMGNKQHSEKRNLQLNNNDRMQNTAKEPKWIDNVQVWQNVL